MTLTAVSSEPHEVGGMLSLQCLVSISHHVNTPVSVDFTWRRSNGLLMNANSRVAISTTTTVSSTTYRSTLSVSDLSIASDSNQGYYCQAVVRSDSASPFVLNSTAASSNTYLLNVSCKYNSSTIERLCAFQFLWLYMHI